MHSIPHHLNCLLAMLNLVLCKSSVFALVIFVCFAYTVTNQVEEILFAPLEAYVAP